MRQWQFSVSKAIQLALSLICAVLCVPCCSRWASTLMSVTVQVFGGFGTGGSVLKEADILRQDLMQDKISFIVACSVVLETCCQVV